MQGQLILENGAVFTGEWVGADQPAYGEVVFNTGMTGYQEILTDPSYCDQIVVMTYPQIGNYGINADDFERDRPGPSALIVSELCDHPSNFRSQMSLGDYLKANGIAALSGIDTRSLVQMIRQHGTLKGYLLPMGCALSDLNFPALKQDQIARVSTKATYQVGDDIDHPHVVLIDFGAKENIIRSLTKRGCRVTVVPYNTSAQAIIALRPDGVFLSNGPGDPRDVAACIPTIRRLTQQFPTMGICMGHQLLALAFGASVTKMGFGHRGSNHPVKDLRTGKVYITSQNHGYMIEESTIDRDVLSITHRNVNDGTVEGFQHRYLPVFSVQYHPEACPGPQDSDALFDQFMNWLTPDRTRLVPVMRYVTPLAISA